MAARVPGRDLAAAVPWESRPALRDVVPSVPTRVGVFAGVHSTFHRPDGHEHRVVGVVDVELVVLQLVTGQPVEEGCTDQGIAAPFDFQGGQGEAVGE